MTKKSRMERRDRKKFQVKMRMMKKFQVKLRRITKPGEKTKKTISIKLKSKISKLYQITSLPA